MNPLDVLCNLASPDSLVSWSHGVPKWPQDAKIAQVNATVRNPGPFATRAVLHIDDPFQEGTLTLPYYKRGA